MDDKKQETLTEVDSQEDICENQKKKRKNNANTQATTIKFHRGKFTNLYLTLFSPLENDSDFVLLGC